MFETKKCCVALEKDGGWVVPHDPDGWTESVQCDAPVVAMEKYSDNEGHVLAVCEKHRHFVQELYAEMKAHEREP